MYVASYTVIEDSGLNMAPMILSWTEVKVQPLFLELSKEKNTNVPCGFCFPLWRHIIIHTGKS